MYLLNFSERKEVEEIKKDSDEKYVVPTSSLQQTLQAIEDNIKSEKQKLSSKDGVDEDKNKAQRKRSVKNKPTGTPEYNPTPLQELKKQKIKGKLGRSKYDLALLQKPQNDSEYDPECNFSTNTHSVDKTDESLPAYASALQNVSAIKDEADDDEEEESSPLAKIPKFVSVDYTPSVIEAEGSDDEPFGEKEEWFSENESVKSNESETVFKTEDKQVKEVNESESQKSLEENTSLPIEFTSDGFVKYAPAQVDTKKRNSEASDKTKTSTEKKDHNDTSEKKKKENQVNSVKDKSNDNIFNLFKDEFDKAFENIEESKESSGKRDTISNVCRKTHKSSSDSDSKSRTMDKKTNDVKHEKPLDNNHKHHSKDRKSSESSKSRHKHNSEHTHSSKDKAVTSKRSSSPKHSSSSKHSGSTSRHSSSKSSGSSSKDSKSSSSSINDVRNKDSHSKNHKEKDSRKSKISSKHNRDASGHSVKKKSIVNLDVDLFGDDVLNLSNSHHDDDLSDLEKYFEDEDPFEECLRIFNEDKGNTDKAKVPEKKVLNPLPNKPCFCLQYKFF